MRLRDGKSTMQLTPSRYRSRATVSIDRARQQIAGRANAIGRRAQRIVGREHLLDDQLPRRLGTRQRGPILLRRGGDAVLIENPANPASAR
jgi:hypothetical protein